MMLLRLLNWQGIAGFGLSIALGILLAIQKGETRHWRKQSAAFEQSYAQSEAAFARTVAEARAAAETARAADQINAARIGAAQRAISERIANDFEARLVAARAAAERLRVGPQTPADPGTGGNAPMSGLSDATAGTSQAAGEDGLPLSDALIASEQAIQLDELIKWVRRQAALNPNAVRGSTKERAQR